MLAKRPGFARIHTCSQVLVGYRSVGLGEAGLHVDLGGGLWEAVDEGGFFDYSQHFRPGFRNAIYFHLGGLDLYPDALATHANPEASYCIIGGSW